MRRKEYVFTMSKGNIFYSSCSSTQACGNGNQDRYRGYSRSQYHPTLPIFIRELGPDDYIYWEWKCERIFMDYDMSKVEIITCALKISKV